MADGPLAKAATADTVSPSDPVFGAPATPYDPSRAVCRRPGYRYVESDGEAFVADANGIGIFRLNPGMLPIWRLLEEQVEAAEIVGVLGEVFPDVPADTLTADVDTALRQLHGAGLIEGDGC